ncbi:DUF1266 domain-containing protein [Spirillospora sp. CA-294931]|uniref:DUF1266 domain-containing protein n=1 Tax=Spirillospora sp. CA-294931 TaxID=3240042 RepID=UPI003D9014FF
MTVQGEAGPLLERAKKYERQGKPEEAAHAYARVAQAMESRSEWAAAIAVRARHARALAEAGRHDEALRILSGAEHAAASLPHAAEAKAVLEGQAAHVLAAAGRPGEGARRAWAAMGAFRALNDPKRADIAGAHAARLIVRDAGPREALRPLRELLAQLTPGGDGHRQVAALLAETERRPDRDHDILVSDPDVPVWGRFAAALAVGAHLAVGNGTPWNSLDAADTTPEENRSMLADSWGVTDPASWREQMDALLEADNSDPVIQVVLARRVRGADPRAWRAAIEAWCREHDISAEGVQAALDLSGEILRYESRFRADGLLAPDGRVESVYAYDFGRAVNMARWGLSAGFCDREAAEECVLTAGHRANRVYASWAEFSAGYVLGRMLRFDGGEFGEWYERSLAGHRVLTDDPASPWRRMAWG